VNRTYLILFYLLESEQNVRKYARLNYPEYPTRRKDEGRFITLNTNLKQDNDEKSSKTNSGN
jgi:hypothetical protein